MRFSIPTVISWFISVLFHPLIISSFGALVLLFWYPEYQFLLVDIKSQYFTMYFVFTYALPLMAIPLYFLIIKLTKVEVTDYHIRLFLLATTTAIYMFSYNVLKEYTYFMVVNIYLLLSSVIMLVSFVITYFWKISLHMIGVGGFLGLIFALLMGAQVYNQLLVVIVILLSGIVATARLQLKAHTQLQVYVGFCLGFVISFVYLYAVFILV